MSVKLHNDQLMPLLGLEITGDEADLKTVVYEGLKFGFKRIECGINHNVQKCVGEAIAKAIEDGLVTRQELWVTCKLRGNDFQSSFEVEPLLRNSLSHLHLEYVELYLISWPAAMIEVHEILCFNRVTWNAMEEVLQKGLARSIGVCHVTVKKLKDMFTFATIMPAVCEVEMNPMLRQDELLDYCKVEGIHVTALDPMGSFDTADTIPHHTRLSPKFNPLKNENVLAVAIELNKSPAQVLVRWALQRGTSVVVKPSVDLSYSMREVLDVFDWELSHEQIRRLDALEPEDTSVQHEAYVTKKNRSYAVVS